MDNARLPHSLCGAGIMDDWTKILGIGGAGGGIGFITAMLIRSALQRGDAVDKRFETLFNNYELRLNKAEKGHDDCLEKYQRAAERIGAIEEREQECLERAAKMASELESVKRKVSVIEQSSSKV
jgi:Skp family chaperone for outer membrane proteins